MAVFVFLAGCDGGDEDYRLQRAYISLFGEVTELDVPDVIRVGESVPVAYTTFGGSCDIIDRDEVRVRGLTATIRSYDRVYQGGCDFALIVTSRSVQIQFDRPGAATVRLQGLRINSGTQETGVQKDEYEIVRTVTVVD